MWDLEGLGTAFILVFVKIPLISLILSFILSYFIFNYLLKRFLENRGKLLKVTLWALSIFLFSILIYIGLIYIGEMLLNLNYFTIFLLLFPFLLIKFGISKYISFGALIGLLYMIFLFFLQFFDSNMPEIIKYLMRFPSSIYYVIPSISFILSPLLYMGIGALIGWMIEKYKNNKRLYN